MYLKRQWQNIGGINIANSREWKMVRMYKCPDCGGMEDMDDIAIHECKPKEVQLHIYIGCNNIQWYPNGYLSIHSTEDSRAIFDVRQAQELKRFLNQLLC